MVGTVLGLIVGTVMMLGVAGPAGANQYEPNDSIATAKGPLTLGDEIRSSIASASDKDYFKFFVEKKAVVQFTLRATDEGKTGYVSIRNSADEILGNKRTFGYLRPNQITGSLDPGTYYLVFESWLETSYGYSVRPSRGLVDLKKAQRECDKATNKVESLQQDLRQAGRAVNKARKAGNKARKALSRAKQTLKKTKRPPAKVRKARRQVALKKRAVMRSGNALRTAKADVKSLQERLPREKEEMTNKCEAVN